MPYLGVRPADITSATEAEIAGDLTVDTNTLHVDAANNRVGVGNSAPSTALDVTGTVTTDGLTSDGDINVSVNNFIHLLDSSSTKSMTLRNWSSSTNSAAIEVDPDQSGSSSYLRIGVDGSEVARFLGGGGLTFNGDTTASNALDDYEEGNWTPSYTTTDGTGFSSIGHHAQYGRYVRVGKQVHAWFYLATNALTKGSASGSVVVIGLPYTVENVDYQSGTIGYSSSWVTNHPITLLGGPNTTQMFIYHTNGSTNHVNSSPANMVDHSGNNKHYLYGALSYRSA